MRRVGKIEPWLWGLAFGMIVYAQALWDWEKGGWGDWGQFHHWWEVGRVSILRWGEFPLWDPHHCGGVSMWGQPQSQHVAPTWWITGLAFGTVAGHKLFILLHSAAGFAGMFHLSRRFYGFRAPAAGLVALTWAYSGFFAWRASGGHSTFLAFHYLPWIFYFWRRTNDDLRYAGGVAGLMALTLMEGGTYPFPLIFLLLAFDFVAQLAQWPPRWAVFRTGLVTGVLTLMMGAIRLWPVYLTMSRFPRNTQMEDSQTWEDVLHSITARAPHDWTWGHRWVWAEYSAHVGWGIVALAVLGVLFTLKKDRRHFVILGALAFAGALVWTAYSAQLGWGILALGAAGALLALRKQRRYLLLGALVFAACAMGDAGTHYPWPLLHKLPLYENFHVPSRFHVLLTFYLCLLAGLAVDRVLAALARRTKRRWSQKALFGLAWFLMIASGAEVLSNSTIIAARWDGSEIVGVPEDRFHLVGAQGYLQQYMHYPVRNVGTRACYDPVPWDISPALWVGDVPQARLDPAAAGEVTAWGRTNHTLFAEVTLEAPARVIFNQNFDPDWRLSVSGGEAVEPVEDHLRLAADLPAGTHRIEARFEPADLPWSVLATLLGALLAILLGLFANPLRFERRRRRRSTSRGRLGRRGA